MTVFGEESPDIRWGWEGPNSLYILGKEADDSFQHSSNRPGRVPFFRVILGDGEADFSVCFEAPVFVHEDNIGGFEGVFVGEYYLSVVETLVEIGVLRSSEGEVPGVEVIG